METTKIKDIASHLESLAPLFYQENYDNSGLLTGDPDMVVSGVLVTLDCTEAVVDEAITQKCNVIVAHHPIIFKGLKKLTGKNYVEKTVIKAIKADIAIYAIHTNIDNVHNGVSHNIAKQMQLKNCRLLVPKPSTLTQLVSFIPKTHVDNVVDALYNAGAGRIGKYEKCSFRVLGTGTFMPTGVATPYVGTKNKLEQVEEMRIEVVFPRHLQKNMITTLHHAHPYEEVAYYLTALQNENQEVGLGMIGELEKPMDIYTFLTYLKRCMKVACIRHTSALDRPIRHVAVCGGAGSALLPHAITHGADVYVSADFKYHDFFEADSKIIIADIGHYESEQFTKNFLKDTLKEKFTTFAVILSVTVTNPINYF